MGSDFDEAVTPSGAHDFNSRSPCGERRTIMLTVPVPKLFQLTLPVWGATGSMSPPRTRTAYFNSRSPCGERPPKRRNTTTSLRHFNSRSPCGERHGGRVVWEQRCISTHAPRVGSDLRQGLASRIRKISTHAPRVGATAHPRHSTPKNGISTHAPRVGSDAHTPCPRAGIHHFNSRSPCGERPSISVD